MDGIVILGISGGVRDGCDSTELDGVSNLIVTDNLPCTFLVMFDFFLELRLITLGLCSHIAHNLHNIGGIKIVLAVKRVVLVLDKIITRCKTGNRIFALDLCSAVCMSTQIRRDRLCKGRSLFCGRNGLCFFHSVSKCGFSRITDTISPDNVGENLFPILFREVAGKDSVSLIGVSCCIVLDCNRVGAFRRKHGCARYQREQQCQQKRKHFFQCFHD